MAIHMQQSQSQSQSYVPFVYPRPMIGNSYWDPRSQDTSDGPMRRNQFLPTEHPGRFQDTSFSNSTRDARFGEMPYIYNGRINRNQPLPTAYSGRHNDNGIRDARFGETPYIYDGRINRNETLPPDHSGRFHDNVRRGARFGETPYIYDGRINRNHALPPEYSGRFHDTSFATGNRDGRFEEMSYISDGRICRNQALPLQHPENDEEPPSQTITRNATDKVPKKKRQIVWIVITRIAAAIFIILDCVSDWLQYSDMQEETNSAGCKSTVEIVKKYMYFTIAGTVLAALQLANIIFQIYCEIRFNKNVQKKDEKKMKYPKKFLDGRTETFYSLLFIEIPQALLVASHQNVCLPSCSVKELASENHLEKKIKIIINGGAALLNNTWRYVTSESFCEESNEGKIKKKDEPCCTKCCESMLKCCCPCCCCLYRYEYTIPFCICGKTFVVDTCKPYWIPWSCEMPFGCCTFYYCPLKDQDDPMGEQERYRVEWIKCKSLNNSYEPFIFHTFLAKIVNVLYTVVFVVNMFKLFCEDNVVISVLANVPDWLSSLL